MTTNRPEATAHDEGTAPPLPAGFRAGGVACGIKPGGTSDLALLACGRPAAAAATLTRNRMRAACVDRTASLLQGTPRGGRIAALVINSGNANCATGAEGRLADRRLAAAAASALGLDDAAVLTASTGTIGVPLPIERAEAALPDLARTLVPAGTDAFARAILTTDTRTKVVSAAVPGTAGTRVLGIAKGSGMIHPDMATMIAVLLTDAEVGPETLDRMLGRVVRTTFNRISVDGDTSTNDAVFALASGAAGPADEAALEAALHAVAEALSGLIVRDGEGVRRTILVEVDGALTEADADRVARTVATSLLVRTAVTGGDPNWGRILAAAGRAGAAFDADRASVRAGGHLLFEHGTPLPPTADAKAAFRRAEVRLSVDLGLGEGAARFRSADLTSEYVRINAEDMT